MEENQGQIDNSNAPQPGVSAPGSDLALTSTHYDGGTVLVAATEPRFYIASPVDGPFLQTEILSEVTEYRLITDSPVTDEGEFVPIIHKLAIIVSQDCDLEQDYHRRRELKESGQVTDAEDEKLLPSILLCEVASESAITDALRVQGRTVRDRFRQNKEERYQFLKAVEAKFDAENSGIEAMGIDFKRYFSVPTEELYVQLSGGCKRRCSLAPHYLEHFSRRFTNHLSRVALPKDHYR
jgi:hypothetical protein